MKTFSIKESIKTSWEIVKANFWFVVGTTFIYGLFNSGLDMKGEDGGFIFRWITFIPILVIVIVFWVVGIIVHIGYTKIYLKLEHGERSPFKELFTHYQPFWKYLGSTILYGLRVLLGFILLVVPGIIWAIKFQFMSVLTIDRGLRPVEAMRESAKMTEGHKLHLFKFSLVVLGVNLLGLLFFVVGLLVTIPLTTLAYLHVYRKLSQTETEILT